MNLKTLIAMASRAYPDDYIIGAYNPKTKHAKEDHGDGLAAFVINELSDTFDSHASTTSQLLEALRVISNAKVELENISDALDKYLRVSELTDRELPLHINDEDPFVRAIIKERLKK